ncbi:c-type cytochrome [Hyphomonas chukchiensis]|uniref:c-type cytochrome n=1 Tax=Hyphomonas chukchiensis TaxID=1280947 RepID=UPI0009DDBA5B
MGNIFRGFDSFTRTYRQRSAMALGMICGIVLSVAAHADPLPTESPDTVVSYTVEQAGRGRNIFRESCSQCHGDSLNNGEFGPPLTGGNFRQHWRGKPILDLYERVLHTMPPAAPNSLGEDAYRDVIAYILQANRVRSDGSEMPDSREGMHAQIIPQ